MKLLKLWTGGLLHLFFPKTCIICARPLLQTERTVCYRCISQLEPSRHTDFSDNEVTHIFEGNIPISFATAGFRYHKGGILQQLIFQLKYHYHEEIGVILGREMGYNLENTPFQTVDLLIPVPLHLKKQRRRGYNQSEKIARGLAEALGKEVRTDVLMRSVHTDSQTSKSRMERFANMQQVFVLKNKENIQGKHILLVDDVVTTGSTLIGCAETLLQEAKDIKISIACLAKAD